MCHKNYFFFNFCKTINMSIIWISYVNEFAISFHVHAWIPFGVAEASATPVFESFEWFFEACIKKMYDLIESPSIMQETINIGKMILPNC